MELKKDDELNISDLLKVPVWEFAFKEMKEQRLNGNMLKPCEQSAPYSPHKARIVVRATFQLKDGTTFKGHIKPIDLLNSFLGHLAPVDLYPVIVTLKGPVPFWYGNARPSSQKIANNYRMLEKMASRVFPITVKSDVEIENGISEGVINGFLYCEVNKLDDFFHVKESDIRIIK